MVIVKAVKARAYNKECRIKEISTPVSTDVNFKTALYIGPCKHIITKLFSPSQERQNPPFILFIR